jgi:hypothetical protein
MTTFIHYWFSSVFSLSIFSPATEGLHKIQSLGD